MAQRGSGDRIELRQDGIASRLPWRYGHAGRRQLAALARSRPAGAGSGTKAARDGYDIDDHIRLAVREESAASLGRAGSKLREAMAALSDADGGSRTSGRKLRQALLQQAALALWEYVVQREAMGLTNHELVNQVYGVTPELWRRMGSVHTFDAASLDAAG